MNKFNIVVKTYAGLEEVLQKELKQKLGIQSEIIKRAVRCSGDLEDVYLINLHIGSALKVLVGIDRFRIFNEKQLYKKLMRIDWEQYLNVDSTFLIDAVVFSKIFNNSHFVALRSKDAICDYFVEKTGKRPSIDKNLPDLRINIHIAEQQVTVSLDSSGDSLHQRGYKKGFHPAPISEVLAHGILKIIDWHPGIPLMDGMCGSGTFISEAGMLATEQSPNFHRKQFGFEKWKNFDSFAWENIQNQAKMAITKSDSLLFANDISPKYVKAAEENMKSAKVESLVQMSQLDFKDLRPPTERGILLFNPPYNERLRVEDQQEFYRSIGDALKKHWSGWTAWMITSNIEALKFVGLRPSRKIHLYNGSLPSRLVKYELYSGSKKAKKQ